MDPSKLERQSLKNEENPAQFLHDFQRKWKEETGSEWNTNEASKALFKLYVNNAMPKEVQSKLNQVVGLMKLDWPVFSEHIIHYVEQCRADKTKQEEQSKLLAGKLTQLQTEELTKNIKKDREKAKYQAAVTTTTSDAKTEPPPEPKV